MQMLAALGLGVPAGPSEHPDRDAETRFVMRLPERLTARRVGVTTGEPWRGPARGLAPGPGHRAHGLRDDDLVVAADDNGLFVRGWWVPEDDGFP